MLDILALRSATSTPCEMGEQTKTPVSVCIWLGTLLRLTLLRAAVLLGLSGLPSPFEQRWCWAPSENKLLDIAAMQRAAAHLVGTHDFTSFGKVLPGDPRACAHHIFNNGSIIHYYVYIRLLLYGSAVGAVF